MAKHQIKIEGVADFSGISKEVNDLSKELDNAFGSDGVEIIDQKALKTTHKEAKAALSDMTSQMTKLKKEALELKKALKETTNDAKKQEEIFSKLAKNDAARANVQRQMNNGRNNVVPFPGGKGKQQSFGSVASKTLSSGIGQIANEVPGVSPGLQVGSAALNAGSAASSAGLSPMAITGIAALGAAATGAAVAVARMASGFEAYKAVTDKILTLNGMGASPIKAGSRGANLAASMGFDDSMVLDTQKGINKSFGGAANQGQDENRLVNLLTASRGLGVGTSQILGGADQLRQVGGTDSSQKQMSLILSKAFADGFDKSQASAYLSAAVGLLSELNQNGATNSNQLLSTMAGLISKNGMSPEMAAKSLGGLSNSISNSSGESNAFFQSAAARAGLGGGSILGNQFAVRQGLSGVDMGALGKMTGDTELGRQGMGAIKNMGLGSEDFAKKFAQSITDEIKGRFDTKSQSGMEAAMGFTNQMFGGKTATDATKTMALLQKIAEQGSNGLNPDDKKMLESLTQDPESAWRDKTLQSLDKTALNTEAVAAALKNGQISLGESSAKIFNPLISSLTTLDNTLNKFLSSDAFTSMTNGVKDLGDMLSSLTESISGAFEKFTLDPEQLGADLAKGFMDNAKGFIKGIFGMGGDDGDASVGKFVGQGAKDAAGSIYDMGDSMFQAASGFAKNIFGGGTQGSPNGAQGAGPDGNAEAVQVLKRIETHMERQGRSGIVPKAGREPSRK